MTDETTDIFYSCTLCQSFAPTHVCVITPERLGLCGAYNWLDGKAAFEIDPPAPTSPSRRATPSTRLKGQWDNVNDFVKDSSGGGLEIQRLQHDGRPHDLLRLLRVHRGLPAHPATAS